MQSPLRAAVIGCGNIARCHFDALQALENVSVTAACDIVPARAAQAAEHNRCAAYTDWRAMLDTVQPDVIHICTPHDLHVEMAVEALRRGIHVLCEKPCAITEASLQVLRKAAEQSSAQFGTCFQNRYNPGVLRAKQLLQEQTHGVLQAVKGDVSWCRGAAYYSDGWHGTKDREGGGVLINQAIHTLDLLRVLAGARTDTVSAHVFNDHLKGVIEVEDTADVRMTFQNGVAGYLHATTAFACDAKVQIDLFCEKALLRLEGADLFLLLPDGSVQRLTKTTAQSTVAKNYWGNGHPALIADFYRCIRTGEPFAIDAISGGEAVEAFLAAYRSAETDAPVRL